MQMLKMHTEPQPNHNLVLLTPRMFLQFKGCLSPQSLREGEVRKPARLLCLSPTLNHKWDLLWTLFSLSASLIWVRMMLSSTCCSVLTLTWMLKMALWGSCFFNSPSIPSSLFCSLRSCSGWVLLRLLSPGLLTICQTGLSLFGWEAPCLMCRLVM